MLVGKNCRGDKTAVSVIQCLGLHKLQDFTKLYVLKRNVSIILRKAASRFLSNGYRLWSFRNMNREAPNGLDYSDLVKPAGDRTNGTFPAKQYDEIMHSIQSKRDQDVYDPTGMSRRAQPILFWLSYFPRTVLFASLLLAVFCFVIYWPFSGLSTSHEHNSCSYRWFSGSWFQESTEVGPTRALSKSWPHTAPPT
ncbi:hypothetical protein AHF37_06002 [Paragonimus kellicotti]|nr:hypothetical protein AHF37_06002 [Paragonimus kellicotti]